MRRIFAMLAMGLVLVGCDRGPTEAAPEPAPTLEQVFGTFNNAAAAGLNPELLRRAPDSLRLTPEQQRRLQALNDAFTAETASETEALGRLIDELVAQGATPFTRAQRESFLRRAVPLMRTINVALDRYLRAVEAILTPAQRTWLLEEIARYAPPYRPLTPTP